MTIEADIINVLRAGKRCKPVPVGKVSFYHFWRHQPTPGAINVAWVKDNRSLQFAQVGYIKDYLEQAKSYLTKDRALFSYVNAFIAPSQLFADEVMRWYGAERPWFQFANYPYRITLPAGKENDIVYVDYSTAVFQRDLYLKLFALFDELYTLTGCTGTLVSRVFYHDIQSLGHSRWVRVVKPREYNYQSRFGILVNLTNFRGAAEALPRKLLLYLHCGMWPLIHGTFAESIYYCQRWGVRPLIYYGPKEAAQLMNRHAKTPRWKRDKFCIEERIGDLVGYLKRLGQ